MEGDAANRESARDLSSPRLPSTFWLRGQLHRARGPLILCLVRNRTLWRDGHVFRAFCQKSRRNRRGNNEDATHDLEQIA
jgi:hypothetical protein